MAMPVLLRAFLLPTFAVSRQLIAQQVPQGHSFCGLHVRTMYEYHAYLVLLILQQLAVLGFHLFRLRVIEEQEEQTRKSPQIFLSSSADVRSSWGPRGAPGGIRV